MKCVICQYGESEPGSTTVALTRIDTTIVIRDVPAHICTICGEEYADAATDRRLSQIAEQAAHEGMQRTYSAIKSHRSRAFDRKVDRNADTLQRTITDVGEHDPAPGATERTATNSHGQSMPSPPFGSSEYLLRTPP